MPFLSLHRALPLTVKAVYDAALVMQAAWVTAAQSGQYFAPGLGSYARGITTQESLSYPDGGDPLAAAVINVAPHAQVIENGAPGLHLPSLLNWAQSAAAKLSKAGRYYLRIPFRHRASRTGLGMTSQAQRQMMPPHVYAMAKTLKPRQRLTAGVTQGQSLHVAGLLPYAPRYAANVRPGYEHSSIYEGMRKQGAKGHTQYMTWRTMTQDSPGWHIPPRVGTQIAAKTAEAVTPQLVQMIGQAVEQDIAALIVDAIGQTGHST